jgi:hypothetical protein
MQFVRTVNSSYYNANSVRAFLIDNDGPTAWYVAAQLTDGATIIQLIDGLASQAAAQIALDLLVNTVGDIAN